MCSEGFDTGDLVNVERVLQIFREQRQVSNVRCFFLIYIFFVGSGGETKNKY